MRVPFSLRPSPVATSSSRKPRCPPIVTCSRHLGLREARVDQPGERRVERLLLAAGPRAPCHRSRCRAGTVNGSRLEEAARQLARRGAPVGGVLDVVARGAVDAVAPLLFEILRVAKQIAARGREEQERDNAQDGSGSLYRCASARASSRRSSTGSRNSTSSSTSLYGVMSSTPRARNQSQTRVTSFSGADAPEVTPGRLDPFEPLLADVGLVVDQVRGDPARTRDLHEPVRVRGVARADHEQELDLAEHLLDGPLPVGRRVTDVFPLRCVHVREAPPRAP